MSDFNIRLGLMPYIPTPFPNQFVLESGLSGYNIDDAGDRLEWFMQIEKTGNITALGFLFGGVVGSPGGARPTLRISLQNIDDATGQPDGAIRTSVNFKPITSPAAADWTGKWQWLSVAPASVTRGEFVAIVIDYISGPIGPPTVNFRPRILNSASGGAGFQYTAANPLAFRQVSPAQPIIGYQVDDASYGWPIQGHNFTAYSNGAMQALRFIFDVGWVDTFRLAGCTWLGKHSSVGGVTYSMRLYEGTTELGRTTVDSDHSVSFKRSNSHIVMFDEGVLPELTSGTEYRLAIVADDAQTAIEMDVFTALSNIEMGAFGGGKTWYMSSRTSEAAAWTDQKNFRPHIDLIINDWGVPVDLKIGIHLKVTPKFNDPMFVQHADDQIEANLVDVPTGTNANEFPGIPIGDAIESYSGYSTIEVFLDPDVARSVEFLIHPEQAIEKLKFVRWEPFVDGTVELVFRLRATEASAVFREVIRFVKVIIPPP